MMKRTEMHARILAMVLLLLLTTSTDFLHAQQSRTPDVPVPPSGNRLAPALRIYAGDLVDVQVFDSPELSGRLRVNSDGEILLPITGKVRVDGLTADEAATRIEQLLLQNQILRAPHASVFVVEYATQGVSLLGEVKTPGVYPVLGAHGLLDFISVAGGLTPTAGKEVSITHKSDPDHPIIVRIDNKPDLATRANIAIQPGDTIVVPRSGIVYVVGDLMKPGGFLIENNDRLTILQAIALAQGANKTAALNNSKLIRSTPEGRTETPVELKKILAGKSSDLKLEDGDILFVPSSEAKTLTYQGIQAAIQMTVGVVTYGRL